MLALTLGTGERPGLFIRLDLDILKGDGLHHLTDGAVCQNHGGHQILVCQIKALDGQAGHFLHGGRRENDHPIVTVTAASGSLKIVGLGGLNAAKSRTAALDVDHQRRHIGTGNVAQSLRFQGDSGAGGGGHYTHTGCGRAVNHIDRRDLTFRLQEHAADFGHLLCHVGSYFCLGCDGISEVMAAAGADGGLCDCFVALHKYSFCHRNLLISPR